MRLPEQGEVYRIRDVVFTPFEKDRTRFVIGIRLAELRNPPDTRSKPPAEPLFLLERFKVL